MHFTARNDLHYGQWFQQKGADPSDHGLLASSSTFRYSTALNCRVGDHLVISEIFALCYYLIVTPCAFLLLEAIPSTGSHCFYWFVVFKVQLIAISGYLYTPCADQVY